MAFPGYYFFVRVLHLVFFWFDALQVFQVDEKLRPSECIEFFTHHSLSTSIAWDACKNTKGNPIHERSIMRVCCNNLILKAFCPNITHKTLRIVDAATKRLISEKDNSLVLCVCLSATSSG